MKENASGLCRMDIADKVLRDGATVGHYRSSVLPDYCESASLRTRVPQRLRHRIHRLSCSCWNLSTSCCSSLRSVYILYTHTHTQQQATRFRVAEQVDTNTMDLTMASPEALTAPQSPGVPRLPDGGFWTSTQWAIFMSLMDSIIPAIVSKASLADREGQLGIPDVEYSAVMKTVQDTAVERRDEVSLKAFMEDMPSTNPAVHESLVRIIARLPPTQQDRLGRFLSSLSYVPTHPLAGITW